MSTAGWLQKDRKKAGLSEFPSRHSRWGHCQIKLTFCAFHFRRGKDAAKWTFLCLILQAEAIMPLLIFSFLHFWRYGGDDTSFPDVMIVIAFECARLNSQESGSEKWMSFFFFLSVQLEMLRLKRIFCFFPRKSQDYLSYCEGLATVGSSVHSQVEWIHQNKTRCQFASPRIFTQNFPLSVGFLGLDNSCSIAAQGDISAVIFCQWWSQFVVISISLC